MLSWEGAGQQGASGGLLSTLKVGVVLRMDKLEQICVILNSNQVCYWASCKCTQPLFMAQVEVMMSDNKTTANDQDVELFLNAVEDEQKRKDSFTILELMKQVSGNEPKMWGSSIVGFGSYRYKGKSGREGDWLVTGFSPRKANLTIYGIGGLEERDDLLKKLGKHTTGKGCLYIKRLSDVDLPTLKKLIEEVVNQGGQNAKPE